MSSNLNEVLAKIAEASAQAAPGVYQGLVDMHQLQAVIPLILSVIYLPSFFFLVRYFVIRKIYVRIEDAISDASEGVAFIYIVSLAILVATIVVFMVLALVTVFSPSTYLSVFNPEMAFNYELVKGVLSK